MADGFTVHVTGAGELIADLSKAASRSIPLVDGVLEKAAVNVKGEYVAEAQGSRHFRGVAPSISYDKVGGFGFLGRAIGPEIGRAGGSLGDIAYHGGSNGGGGTLDLDGPLDREEPRLVKAFADGLADLL